MFIYKLLATLINRSLDNALKDLNGVEIRGKTQWPHAKLLVIKPELIFIHPVGRA